MSKKLLSGLAALTLLDISASTAQAQVPDWSGAYIGVHGGYRWSDGSLTTGTYTLNNPVDIDPVIPARNETYDLGSGIFGLHGGYNVRLGAPWIVGLEGDFTWGNGEDSRTRTISLDGAAYTLNSRAELSWQGTIRARLGVTSGAWLFYATAGVAFADFEWRETYARTTAPTFSFSAAKSDTLTGYTVGAGAELALSRNWIVRGEYLYEDFGSFNVPLAAALPVGTQGSFDVDAHKLRLGISYKF